MVFNCLRYVLYTNIFIAFVFLNKMIYFENFSYEFVPDIVAMVIFYTFISNKTKNEFNYIFILFLGIIFDVLNLLPTGLTSLSWLLIYQFIKIIKKYVKNDDILLEFTTFTIFIFLNYFLRLFFMTYIFDNLYSLKPIFFYTFFNTVYYFIFLNLRIKIKNELNR